MPCTAVEWDQAVCLRVGHTVGHTFFCSLAYGDTGTQSF